MAVEGYNAYQRGAAPDDFSARGSARQRAAASVAQRQRDELRQRGISEYGDLVGAYEGAEQRAQEMLGERQRLAESTIAGMGAQALGAWAVCVVVVVLQQWPVLVSRQHEKLCGKACWRTTPY